MYVILKQAVSLDGYIDDCSSQRLILSCQEDLEYLDEVRAECDAILVGAGTIRTDNPRLTIRSTERQKARKAAGKPAHPVKVTVTRSGNLSPHCAFFSEGDSQKIVFCPENAEAELRRRLAQVATVVALSGTSIRPDRLIGWLEEFGLTRLLIEGGTRVAAMFIDSCLVSELQLSIAPFLVGEPAAPRFLGSCAFSHGKNNRMKLLEVVRLGDTVLLRYQCDASVGHDLRQIAQSSQLE